MRRTLEDCIRQMVKVWITLKRQRCEETGARTDLHPTLHFVFDTVPDQIVVCPRGTEDFPWSIASIEEGAGEPIAFVGVLGDAYGATVPLQEVRPGEAERRFRAGEAGAYEALTVRVYDVRANEWTGVNLRYKYDGHVPKFGSVHPVADREFLGRTREVIERALHHNAMKEER